MSKVFTYRTGAERPTLTLPWQEQTAAYTWTDLDLSSGYTFSLTLVDEDGTTALTKTTNITGANGSVVVTWAADDLALDAGTYTLNLRATTSSLDRDYSPGDPIKIRIRD